MTAPALILIGEADETNPWSCAVKWSHALQVKKRPESPKSDKRVLMCMLGWVMGAEHAAGDHSPGE
jgi:hypothetical protein